MSTPIDTFIKDWFQNPEWWFSKTKECDIHITEHYESLLSECNNINKINNTNILGYILVYDQIPRHIFRNQHANHIIQYFLQKAIDIVNKYNTSFRPSSDKECIFFWLPYRHSGQYRLFIKAMENIWKYVQMKDTISPLMKKCLRASYMNFPIENQQTQILSYDIYEKVVDTLDTFYSILDYTGSIDDNERTSNIKCIQGDFQYFNNVNKKTVIVSLSGGVDSMVLLQKMQETNIDVVAVHINYSNRETSLLEEKFVVWWCGMRNVPIYIRRITEINRPTCMKYELRDVYETYTRNVRYNTYKTIDTRPIVVLGHNRDDCFENILTNMTARYKYDNLKGMCNVQYENDITFVRPFLNIAKNDIVTYAKHVGIPYLYDSTPTWSQRGKIRDTIVPTLQTWNPKTIDGFYEMSDVLAQSYTFLRDTIRAYILSLKYIDPNKIILEQNTLPKTLIFWDEFFKQAFHVTISKKSLENFIGRLCKISYVEQKIILQKDIYLTYFKTTHDICICTFHLRKKSANIICS